jgi:hypothetical protein
LTYSAAQHLISLALVSIPVALCAIVMWALSTRTIDLSGLLHGDRASGESYFSPGRVQLLVVTSLFTVNLVAHIVADPSAFPPIPKELLAALGGSQLVYLGGKARAMLR